jgi:hypothetical protein
MARNSQKEATQPPQELSPTPSQQPSQNPVSLQGPPADVPQPGPTPEIVIKDVLKSVPEEAALAPVVEVEEDGSITIR